MGFETEVLVALVPVTLQMNRSRLSQIPVARKIILSRNLKIGYALKIRFYLTELCDEAT